VDALNAKSLGRFGGAHAASSRDCDGAARVGRLQRWQDRVPCDPGVAQKSPSEARSHFSIPILFIWTRPRGPE
jgi:hypothetical protein